ncbi:MAG: hypothetical protein J6Q17_04075 [Clostridia bacterium]|nr:hypothetical protein [Clostridia bacterium]
MTVQLPVLVWTVICFCLFALILDRLLFRPLLAHMDRRSEKIARAAQLRREHGEKLAAAEEELARYRRDEEARLRELAAFETGSAAKEAKALRDGAERRRKEATENAAAALGTESEELAAGLADKTEEFAAVLAAALTESLPGPGNGGGQGGR